DPTRERRVPPPPSDVTLALPGRTTGLGCGRRSTLSAQSFPTTLIVDRQGRLAARALGGQIDDVLESMLQPVLAEQQS
ncbi:TlpA family protein disulfide reductase, partial [Kitasatospora sp. NPDC058406]|uniref:TlpA family protein disulfide reductase n=1 Tax=Kitasatospora sp. NPDC058406 TaxID=3346483 RepID=UPI003648CBFE